MNDRIYEAYFGVTEDEVRDLFREYKSVSFEELKQWYDGYRMSDGRRLFNPRSVLTHIFAIAQNNEGKEWIQKNLRFSRKP
ncbi:MULTISPECIES: AAA family ATPase [Anaerovoracaceae]